MLDLARNRHKALRHMLLALVLLQSVFVGFELGAEPEHLGEYNDTHHTSVSIEQDLHLDSIDSHKPDSILKSNLSQADNCDHCCYCHGHGSHTIILSEITISVIPVSKIGISRWNQPFSSNHAKTIYRPPIA